MRSLLGRTVVLGFLSLTAAACGSASPPPGGGQDLTVAAMPDLTARMPDLQADKPNAPTKLTVTPLVKGAHITWQDNSSDEDGFTLMGKMGNAKYMEVATVPFNTTVYHNAPLATGAEWTFMVQALKGDVLSDPSNEVTVTIK